MADFIIRPVESYATVDTKAYNDKTKTWEDVPRGTAVTPKQVFGGNVFYDVEDGSERCINLEDFVRVFTADQREGGAVSEARKEETSWFPKVEVKKEKKDPKGSK